MYILNLGTGIYLIERPQRSAYFIQILGINNLFSWYMPVIGSSSDNLPTFFHVCAFSLITGSFIRSNMKRTYLYVCISWITINIIFECFQTSIISEHIKAESLNIFKIYSKSSTFDIIDIVFALLGGFISYLILIFILRKDLI